MEARAALLLAECDLEGAEAAALALLARALTANSPRHADEAREAAAHARLPAGDPPGALALMGPALERYLDLVERGAGAEVESVARKVEVLVAGGDEERAAALLAWGRAQLPDHPRVQYCAALLGLARDPEGAAAQVEAAAEADGWRVEAARERVVAAGIVAAADGGRAAAVMLLRAAMDRFADVFRKLGATNRATAVRLATKEGLLDAGMATSAERE